MSAGIGARGRQCVRDHVWLAVVCGERSGNSGARFLPAKRSALPPGLAGASPNPFATLSDALVSERFGCLIGGAPSENSRFNVGRGVSPHRPPAHRDTCRGMVQETFDVAFCFPSHRAGLTDGAIVGPQCPLICRRRAGVYTRLLGGLRSFQSFQTLKTLKMTVSSLTASKFSNLGKL